MSNTTHALPARQTAILQSIAAVAVANVLLILSAKVQVPFWPVPMTMQSLVVVLLGMALGLRLGMATIGLYLIEGLAGLPVFAGTPERGIGLAYALGPTGGYLVGFVLCVMVVGYLSERRYFQSIGQVAMLNLAGHAIILGCGAAWLSILSGSQFGWSVSIAPFLLGTAVKSGLGVALMRPALAVQRALKR